MRRDSDGFCRWDAAQSYYLAQVRDVLAGKPEDTEFVTVFADLLRLALSADEGEAKAVLASRTTLNAKFPDFATLSDKRELKLDEVRARLSPTEGVVSFLVSRDQSFVQLVRRDGITRDELERGKGQLRGGLVLGLEDSGSRMSRIGKAELVQGYVPPVDELLADIDAVSLADVCEVAEAVLSAPPTLAVIGPFDSERQFASVIA